MIAAPDFSLLADVSKPPKDNVLDFLVKRLRPRWPSGVDLGRGGKYKGRRTEQVSRRWPSPPMVGTYRPSGADGVPGGVIYHQIGTHLTADISQAYDIIIHPAEEFDCPDESPDFKAWSLVARTPEHKGVQKTAYIAELVSGGPFSIILESDGAHQLWHWVDFYRFHADNGFQHFQGEQSRNNPGLELCEWLIDDPTPNGRWPNRAGQKFRVVARNYPPICYCYMDEPSAWRGNQKLFRILRYRDPVLDEKTRKDRERTEYIDKKMREDKDKEA